MRSPRIGRSRKLKNDSLVTDKGKSDLRMTDRLQMKLMFDVAALGVFRAQKFPARRQIVKKRAHFDLRARRFAAVAHRLDPPAGDDDLRAGDRVRFAGR